MPCACPEGLHSCVVLCFAVFPDTVDSGRVLLDLGAAEGRLSVVANDCCLVAAGAGDGVTALWFLTACLNMAAAECGRVERRPSVLEEGDAAPNVAARSWEGSRDDGFGALNRSDALKRPNATSIQQSSSATSEERNNEM